MTRIHFDLLPELQKLSLVFREGTLLASRKEGLRKVDLYRIYQFYVELFYQKSRLNVEKLQSFASPAFLEPYVRDLMEEA